MASWVEVSVLSLYVTKFHFQLGVKTYLRRKIIQNNIRMGTNITKMFICEGISSFKRSKNTFKDSVYASA